MAKAIVSNGDPVKRALVAYMLDEGLSDLHISPAAAGKVLLDPDGWDVTVRQDRNGIFVTLIDNQADEYQPNTMDGLVSVTSFGGMQNEARMEP